MSAPKKTAARSARARARCFACDKPIRLRKFLDRECVGGPATKPAAYWQGYGGKMEREGIAPDPLAGTAWAFCSLKCCEFFAWVLLRDGSRLQFQGRTLKGGAP